MLRNESSFSLDTEIIKSASRIAWISFCLIRVSAKGGKWEFKIKTDGIEGRMVKIEKPFVVMVQADPWNSELHQFATKEEAMEFVGTITE